MKTRVIFCGSLMVMLLLDGCSKPLESGAGYNPPAPKSLAQIKQEIDADPKIPANMKAQLKERVESGGGGLKGSGSSAAMPADVAGYLKSSGASRPVSP